MSTGNHFCLPSGLSIHLRGSGEIGGLIARASSLNFSGKGRSESSRSASLTSHDHSMNVEKWQSAFSVLAERNLGTYREAAGTEDHNEKQIGMQRHDPECRQCDKNRREEE